MTSGLEYTSSLWNNSIDNTIWIYWLNDQGHVISVDSTSSADSEFKLSAIAPEKATFAQLVTYQTSKSNLQFQLGNVATAYRVSAYDSINNVILAQKEVKDKQQDLDENLANFNKYSLETYQATENLNKILEDNSINSSEKEILGPTTLKTSTYPP